MSYWSSFGKVGLDLLSQVGNIVAPIEDEGEDGETAADSSMFEDEDGHEDKKPAEQHLHTGGTHSGPPHSSITPEHMVTPVKATSLQHDGIITATNGSHAAHISAVADLAPLQSLTSEDEFHTISLSSTPSSPERYAIAHAVDSGSRSASSVSTADELRSNNTEGGSRGGLINSLLSSAKVMTKVNNVSNFLGTQLNEYIDLHNDSGKRNLDPVDSGTTKNETKAASPYEHTAAEDAEDDMFDPFTNSAPPKESPTLANIRTDMKPIQFRPRQLEYTFGLQESEGRFGNGHAPIPVADLSEFSKGQVASTASGPEPDLADISLDSPRAVDVQDSQSVTSGVDAGALANPHHQLPPSEFLRSRSSSPISRSSSNDQQTILGSSNVRLEESGDGLDYPIQTGSASRIVAEKDTLLQQQAADSLAAEQLLRECEEACWQAKAENAELLEYIESLKNDIAIYTQRTVAAEASMQSLQSSIATTLNHLQEREESYGTLLLQFYALQEENKQLLVRLDSTNMETAALATPAPPKDSERKLQLMMIAMEEKVPFIVYGVS
jgi:hypothetical protein